MKHINVKVFIEICLLKLINNKDYESYHLIKQLNDVLGFNVNDVYPIIYRLINQGYLESYEVETSGAKEKFYTLSTRGKDYYELIAKDLEKFQRNFNDLIKDDHHE